MRAYWKEDSQLIQYVLWIKCKLEECCEIEAPEADHHRHNCYTVDNGGQAGLCKLRVSPVSRGNFMRLLAVQSSQS